MSITKLSTILRGQLTHPLMKGKDPEAAESIESRRKMLREKPMLREIYLDWYQFVLGQLPSIDGQVLELGTGPGFLNEYIADLITSDITDINGVEHTIDAAVLPFSNESLRGIVLINVLHHIKDSTSFLSEANRCLKKGGKIIMIEPWMTPWAKAIYTYLHQEAVDVETPEWSLPKNGPLSDANVALPWIIFQRDRDQFECKFPHLSVDDLSLTSPFAYLLSGGITLKCLVPNFTRSFWHWLDTACKRWHSYLAMFAKITIVKPK